MENFDFGRRLKELRKEKGVGQAELAQDIGASKAIVSLWENNMRTPGMENIRLLSDYFEISSDYLIGRTNDF